MAPRNLPAHLMQEWLAGRIRWYNDSVTDMEQKLSEYEIVRALAEVVGGVAVEVVRKDIKNLHLGVYPPNGRVRVAAPLTSLCSIPPIPHPCGLFGGLRLSTGQTVPPHPASRGFDSHYPKTTKGHRLGGPS